MDLVTVDNRLGAYELTEHLIWHGHQRIGIIAGPLHESSAGERLEGYKKALAEHGLEPDPELIAVGDWKQESGVPYNQSMVGTCQPPDGHLRRQ